MDSFKLLLQKISKQKVICVMLFFVILLNVACAVLYLFYKQLDADEFQHMHIVWNMASNAEVIYRDFWDHHGVVYPFINYVLFKVFDPGISFSVYYFYRSTSLIYMLLMGLLTYKISLTVFSKKVGALLSVTVLSSLFFFHMKGIEMRPDVLQNVFWLAGLLYVVRHLHRPQRYDLLLAGIWFGLACATNTKALLGIAGVGIFLVFKFILTRTPLREVIRSLALWGGGMALVQVPILLYFAVVNGIPAYYNNIILFNFTMFMQDSAQRVFPWYWDILVHDQLPFLAASFGGVLLLAYQIIRQKDLKTAFLLFITLWCSVGAFFGAIYLQFWLLFLPLLAIISAYFLESILSLGQRNKLFLCVGMLVVASFFLVQERYLVSDALLRSKDPTSWSQEEIRAVTMFKSLPFLQIQKDTHAFVIENLGRSDIVASFWTACGGYSLNKDMMYYWGSNELHNDAATAMTGSDAYKGPLIKKLKDMDVRYITFGLGDPPVYAGLTYKYIVENYHYVTPCLLERNF